MPNFKLTIEAVSNAQLRVGEMEARFGEDFDADLGDFVATAKGSNVVEVIVNDVAKGDVRALAADYRDEYEDGYIVGSIQDGTNWFPFDVEGDDD